MAYEELVEFIDEEMRMSHIYQPAMLILDSRAVTSPPLSRYSLTVSPS